MATTDRKQTANIRFNSGDNVMFKRTSVADWENLGHLVSGKLSRKGNTIEVVLADRNTVKGKGKRDCTVNLVFAQTDKTVMDALDDLIATSEVISMLIYNGTANAKHQEYYFAQVSFVEQFEVDMKGDAAQHVGVDILVLPQSANVSVNTFSGLPAEAKAYAATPGATVTGKNPYYVILETAVTAPSVPAPAEAASSGKVVTAK